MAIKINNFIPKFLHITNLSLSKRKSIISVTKSKSVIYVSLSEVSLLLSAQQYYRTKNLCKSLVSSHENFHEVS